jgi:methylated-DNA-protein-cysteine methyltransferase-like protein
VDDEYAEAVLDVVAAIPSGRVMTYGAIAEVLRDRLDRGGPRMVGRVMAVAGGGVPWWRVVNAAGEPPTPYRGAALAELRREGTPLTSDDDDARVVVRNAVWWPQG